ncbi:MAG: thermonuclease family protein [SAR324 cluster bacterium]|nr:thermonuclease family protein [SAR324 cluster bacterium]
MAPSVKSNKNGALQLRIYFTFLSFFLTAASVIFVAPAAQAQTKTFKNVRVVACHDGDTCRFDFLDVSPRMFGQALPVRLKGFDTAELGKQARCKRESKLATKQRNYLRSLFKKSKNIMIKVQTQKGKKGLVELDRDKYGRILGEVYVNGRSVANEMIKKAGARKNNGGFRKGWCGRQF